VDKLVDGARVTDKQEEIRVPGLDEALRELGIHVGSAVLRYAAERAGIAASSSLPVLLLGETGTGKERFAHLIHRLSPRSPFEMVIINCAAIPKDIAESHLFGHIKGSFSGATADQKGVFEAADQNTLFLDEVAELPLEMQAKLLRVIQDGSFQRVGSTKPLSVNVRIIAATNRDLAKEVAAGRFREDLYFRLEVLQIKLPALRERRAEIPELALVILRQINQRRLKPRQLSKEALLRLERYDWPGNVRELCNVLERSVLYAPKESLEAKHLQPGQIVVEQESLIRLWEIEDIDDWPLISLHQESTYSSGPRDKRREPSRSRAIVGHVQAGDQQVLNRKIRQPELTDVNAGCPIRRFHSNQVIDFKRQMIWHPACHSIADDEFAWRRTRNANSSGRTFFFTSGTAFSLQEPDCVSVNPSQADGERIGLPAFGRRDFEWPSPCR